MRSCLRNASLDVSYRVPFVSLGNLPNKSTSSLLVPDAYVLTEAPSKRGGLKELLPGHPAGTSQHQAEGQATFRRGYSGALGRNNIIKYQVLLSGCAGVNLACHVRFPVGRFPTWAMSITAG